MTHSYGWVKSCPSYAYKYIKSCAKEPLRSVLWALLRTSFMMCLLYSGHFCAWFAFCSMGSLAHDHVPHTHTNESNHAQGLFGGNDFCIIGLFGGNECCIIGLLCAWFDLFVWVWGTWFDELMTFWTWVFCENDFCIIFKWVKSCPSYAYE